MFECLVDGEITDRISTADRGLTFGDGVFENIAVFNGSPRFWQSHMDRLEAGCERLGLESPRQQVLLRDLQTVSQGLGNCMVRILLTRRAPGATYRHGGTRDVRRVVYSYAWPDTSGNLETLGISTRICDLRLAIRQSAHTLLPAGSRRYAR